MAFTRLKETKDGRQFYEIIVRRGREKSQLTTRWYVPDGWGERAIQRELAKQAADFERKCKNGEIQSRKERKAAAEQAAAEEAKIKTVRRYGEEVFMPAKTPVITENTRSSFQTNLDHWIYPAIGDTKLPEVTPAQIADLFTLMSQQGKSHATMVKVYSILNLIFSMAMEREDLDRNPMDKVKRPKAKKDEKPNGPVKSYTVEEVQKILARVDAEPIKWRCMLRLLIDTGIRRGEACGIKWEDINFKDNTITIRGNLCYTPKAGVYLDTPKDGEARTMGVDPEVMQLFRELREDYDKKGITCPYVFVGKSYSRVMHPSSVLGHMKKYEEEYGVTDFHPHMLRHTWASIAITSGADVASVSEKLGHSDKAVTLRMYTHSNQAKIDQASNTFREALKAKPQGSGEGASGDSQ